MCASILPSPNSYLNIDERNEVGLPKAKLICYEAGGTYTINSIELILY